MPAATGIGVACDSRAKRRLRGDVGKQTAISFIRLIFSPLSLSPFVEPFRGAVRLDIARVGVDHSPLWTSRLRFAVWDGLRMMICWAHSLQPSCRSRRFLYGGCVCCGESYQILRQDTKIKMPRPHKKASLPSLPRARPNLVSLGKNRPNNPNLPTRSTIRQREKREQVAK
jgi:hypothetical protein